MSRIVHLLLISVLTGSMGSLAIADERPGDVNDVAEAYVKLVLEIGQYDADYVDAYFGPPEWRPPEAQEGFPAERLAQKTDELIGRLGRVDAQKLTGLEKQRHTFLEKQLRAVRIKIDLLAGKEMSFDEESKALYDVVAPAHDEAHFQAILDKLDRALPGEDDLYWRFNNYRTRFTIPRDRLKQALDAATSEYHRRTQEHLWLPEGESFDMRPVTGKPWGAAATYKGDGLSLIEVNTQMPFGAAEIHKLAGHEIYPGHHVHLSLLDKCLVKDKKWVEYTVLPLHSPLAMISEGLAEYGSRDLVMTTPERIEFDRTILFPLAGLDPNEARNHHSIMMLKDELDGAIVEAARRYLDGRMDRAQTHEWLTRYALVSPGGVGNLIAFIEKYRTYVVNYTVGRTLIRDYIERQAGPNSPPAQRWQLFQTLLSTPQTPSGLAAAER